VNPGARLALFVTVFAAAVSLVDDRDIGRVRPSVPDPRNRPS
jgi:hypothetical protein